MCNIVQFVKFLRTNLQITLLIALPCLIFLAYNRLQRVEIDLKFHSLPCDGIPQYYIHEPLLYII